MSLFKPIFKDLFPLQPYESNKVCTWEIILSWGNIQRMNAFCLELAGNGVSAVLMGSLWIHHLKNNLLNKKYRVQDWEGRINGERQIQEWLWCVSVSLINEGWLFHSGKEKSPDTQWNGKRCFHLSYFHVIADTGVIPTPLISKYRESRDSCNRLSSNSIKGHHVTVPVFLLPP